MSHFVSVDEVFVEVCGTTNVSCVQTPAPAPPLRSQLRLLHTDGASENSDNRMGACLHLYSWQNPRRAVSQAGELICFPWLNSSHAWLKRYRLNEDRLPPSISRWSEAEFQLGFMGFLILFYGTGGFFFFFFFQDLFWCRRRRTGETQKTLITPNKS